MQVNSRATRPAVLFLDGDAAALQPFRNGLSRSLEGPRRPRRPSRSVRAYRSRAVSGRLWELTSDAARLPLGVLAAVDGGAVRAAMDVVNARLGRRVARVGGRGVGRPAVLAPRKRILWHTPHVAVGHQRIQRRWILV